MEHIYMDFEKKIQKDRFLMKICQSLQATSVAHIHLILTLEARNWLFFSSRVRKMQFSLLVLGFFVISEKHSQQYNRRTCGTCPKIKKYRKIDFWACSTCPPIVLL